MTKCCTELGDASLKKKSNYSSSYVIQDLSCFSCQEGKLILLKLRQNLTTEAHEKKEDAPARVEFSAGDGERFDHPGHLAARWAAFMLSGGLSALNQVKWPVKCSKIRS